MERPAGNCRAEGTGTLIAAEGRPHPDIVGGAPALPNCAQAGQTAIASTAIPGSFMSVGLRLRRQTEVDAAVVILFRGCLDIEVS